MFSLLSAESIQHSSSDEIKKALKKALSIFMRKGKSLYWHESVKTEVDHKVKSSTSILHSMALPYCSVFPSLNVLYLLSLTFCLASSAVNLSQSWCALADPHMFLLTPRSSDQMRPTAQLTHQMEQNLTNRVQAGPWVNSSQPACINDTNQYVMSDRCLLAQLIMGVIADLNLGSFFSGRKCGSRPLRHGLLWQRCISFRNLGALKTVLIIGSADTYFCCGKQQH